MKKNICFIGFGEVEAVALQPSLAGMSTAWECVFLPNEAAAQEAMESKAFDGLVFNLGPRGLNESTFLQQTATKYPSTLRFVVGNQADRDLILSCAGTAHQFICRPWKPPELVSVVERSLVLDGWLCNDKLRSFIPRLGALPALPATYAELVKKADATDSNAESLAPIITANAGLTGRLMEMLNSSAAGLDKKLNSPAQALSILGPEAIKAVVLCLEVFDESTPAKAGGLSLEQLWQHSFSVAKMAGKIVLHCIASERMAGDAYAAGLLHNIGQIMLATRLSKEYATIVTVARKQKRPLHEMELELLGVTNNQVGAYLLGLWGLPLPVVEATALYPTPAKATPVEFSLLTVVHVANVLASEDGKNPTGLPLPELDIQYLGTLDLPKRTDGWRTLLAKKIQKPEKVRKPESNTEIRAADRPPLPKSSMASAPSRPLPVKKILAVAALAAIVVAALAFKPHLSFSSLSSLPAVIHHQATAVVAREPSAPAPTDKPSAADGTAAAPPDSPFDAVKIKSIIYSATHPVVLINGAALEVGGEINGISVVSIGRSEVVLACKGEKKTFKLNAR